MRRSRFSWKSLVHKGLQRQKLSVVGSRFKSMSTTQLPPDATLIGDAFGRVLTSVRGALAGLVDTQAWTLDDNLLLERFNQAAAVKAAAEELMARFAGEAQDRDLPKRHGASSLRSLLMSHRLFELVDIFPCAFPHETRCGFD